MKKNILPILCVVLAVALIFTVVGLISANKKADAAVEQLQILASRVQALEEENLTLRLQQSWQETQWSAVEGEEAYHCTLVIESWSAQTDFLTVEAFAQAVLPPDAAYSAQLELWLGSDVIAAQPITLTASEAAGIFDTDVSVDFSVPAIGDGEELQLWLVVESVGCDTLFHCGGSWYPENGQLMLITG